MPAENRAVFLDRDGVLIHDVHYLSEIKQIKLYDDVPEGLRTLQKNGYKLIVVTNQSGVARGFFTEDFVKATHNHLSKTLSNYGVTLDGFYYCPHHIAGKPPYNFQCDCRKPSPGMIIKAVAEFGINCHNSFMVGDKLSDIELAINSKTQGILVKTGKGLVEAPKISKHYPDIPVFDNFSQTVSYICQIDPEK